MQLSAAHIAKAEALLTLAGALSISLDDAGDDPVLEPPPGEAPLWPVVVCARTVSDRDGSRAARGAVARTPALHARSRSKPLDDAQWEAALRRVTPARQIGRLRLAAAADDRARRPDARPTCGCNMGLAFGTGEHPTTALCLEWLEARMREGDRVLDYGCGSGILALAALALGASYAWAVDTDPQALQATSDNAALNGFPNGYGSVRRTHCPRSRRTSSSPTFWRARSSRLRRVVRSTPVALSC